MSGFLRETMHNVAIQKIFNRHSDVQVGQVNSIVRTLAKQFDLALDPEAFFRRHPDAWSYAPWHDDEYPGTITIFEIEDTHPISLQKLKDYAENWFFLDCSDIALRLIVYDRYGEHERELDLMEYWFLFRQNEIATETLRNAKK